VCHLKPGQICLVVFFLKFIKKDSRELEEVHFSEEEDISFLVPCLWVSVGQYFIFGALCPSKSGLLDEHIVNIPVPV